MKIGVVSSMLLILALLGPACGSSEPPLQGVVLIVLDTVRADHLGCYGYERATSPRLDALAREGVRFEQTVAPSSWTLPSMSSLLAGGNGARVFQGQGLGASAVESLQAAGLHTAAFTEGGYVSRHFGLDLGFDTWTEEEGPVQQLTQADQELDENPVGGIERTFAHAERWLSEIGDRRFFLIVHTYEAHAPYTHGELARGLDPGRFSSGFTMEDQAAIREDRIELTNEEVEYITAHYDSDIAYADRHVGGLLDRLDQLGLADRVAVVVTSDHGEDTGGRYPRNRFDHGHSLLDGLVLVPLILHDPTRDFPRREVASQVRLFDVLPTVADLLDVPLALQLDGRSLVPLMEGREDSERVATLGNTQSGPARIGLRALGKKYVRTVEGAPLGTDTLVPEPPLVQLYDLRVDPGEVDNLAELRPAAVTALEQLMMEHAPVPGAAKIPSQHPEDIDPKLLERLRSLGYVR